MIVHSDDQTHGAFGYFRRLSLAIHTVPVTLGVVAPVIAMSVGIMTLTVSVVNRTGK